MALAGLTYGIVVPSSYCRATSKVIQAGYANDSNTSVMISGTNFIYYNKKGSNLFFKSILFIG